MNHSLLAMNLKESEMKIALSREESSAFYKLAASILFSLLHDAAFLVSWIFREIASPSIQCSPSTPITKPKVHYYSKANDCSPSLIDGLTSEAHNLTKLKQIRMIG